MYRRIVLATLLAASTIAVAIAAPSQDVDRRLQAGKYSAKVTAIPCAACPPEIVKTLNAQAAIEDVSVDPKASAVTFTIKPGMVVLLSDLQKALKTASDQMGMGADYQLKNVKKAS